MNKQLNDISAIDRFAESNKFPTSRISILLAEDNAIAQRLSLEKLKSIGYKCDTAKDGEQALQMALSKSYDLILMDIHMPVMNGIKSAEKISQNAQENQPVIVALTSDTSSQTRNDCFAAGMRDFMPKPLQIDHLKSFITKVWSRQFNQEN